MRLRHCVAIVAFITKSIVAQAVSDSQELDTACAGSQRRAVSEGAEGSRSDGWGAGCPRRGRRPRGGLGGVPSERAERPWRPDEVPDRGAEIA